MASGPIAGGRFVIVVGASLVGSARAGAALRGRGAGEASLTSGGAFRITPETPFTTIGGKPELDMRAGLARRIAWWRREGAR